MTVTKRIRNFYSCATCRKVFSRKGVSVDHIEPVVNPKKGWESLEVFVTRLFCSKEGFQIICNSCHDKKTASERLIRQRYKKKKKGKHGG